LAVNAPVDCVPLVALLPDQPPDAVHAVALAADQLKVDAFPVLTELGVAEKLTVGAAAVDFTETAADPVALPPEPVHVSE
jgi:hypothetical protein